MSTKTGANSFTSKKAQFLNMAEDGIKIRAAKFKNKKAYNRNDRSWKQD